MPPAFMRRISRSSSGLVTAGPNHHQRIMIRASSGGCSKALFSWPMLDGVALKAMRHTTAIEIALMGSTRKRTRTMLGDGLCFHKQVWYPRGCLECKNEADV